MARRSPKAFALARRQLQSPKIHALVQDAERAMALGLFEQACQLADEALSIAPDLEPILALRARALVRMNQLDRAQADIEQALASWPVELPAWRVTEALVHRARGDYQQAATILEHARERFPASQVILSTLTELYISMRKHDQAYDMLSTVIAKGGNRPGVLVQFGRMCRIKHIPEQAVEPLKRALDDPACSVSERKRVAFELGMVYDAMGEIDRAFEAFATANNLEARLFDIDRHSALVDAMIETWTRPMLQSLPVADSVSAAGLVLIVGMRRSGSTLTEQILASHSKVVAGGELPWLRRAAQPLSTEPDRAQSLIVSTKNITQATINQVGCAYMSKVEAARGDRSVFTDKLPANFEMLNIAQLALPGVKAVWCQRDPLNTCLSCYMQPFNDNSYCADLRTLARYYHDCMRLMTHWQQVLDVPIHVVRYETMVQDAHTQIQALLEALELPFEQACLKFYQTRRTPRTVSTDQVAQKMYTSSLDRASRYRAHLQPLIDELTALGYSI